MPLAFGRALIALAAAITAVVPVLTDWNETHVFNPRWPPHARFHMATSLGMATILSPAALWLLWRRLSSPPRACAGRAWRTRGVRLPRLAGLPTNVLSAGATTLSAGLGWYLDRRARSQSGW